jgi:hypothetical protein
LQAVSGVGRRQTSETLRDAKADRLGIGRAMGSSADEDSAGGRHVFLLVGVVVPQMHGAVYAMAIAACALVAIAARPGLPVARRTEARIAHTA